jgi:O-antigen/teichoic acid export membrane protein
MSVGVSSKNALRGVGYLSLVNIVTHVVGLVRVAILARLLSPVDFGIFALAMVLIKGLEMITAVGTQSYIVQKEKIDDEFVGNAWTVNIIRGLIICFFVMSLSPIYSHSVNEPRVKSVLYLIALTPFFDGFTNPGKYLAVRRVAFGRVGLYEMSRSLLQTIIVIILAYLLRDVRAMALGMAGASFLVMLISFPMFGRPPKPKFNKDILKELLSVGKHFIIIQIGVFIMSQADNLIVGIIGGTSVVGIYVVAYRVCEIPLTLLRRVVGRVAMPVYSRIQSDKERLSKTIQSLLQLQLALIVPLSIFVFILARPIILTVYGDKWSAAIPILQALVLVLVARGITEIIAPFVIGTGNFKFASKVKSLEVIVFLLGVYVGTLYYGAVGAALGAGTGYLVSVGVRIWFVCQYSRISFLRFFQNINKPLLSSIPGIIGCIYFAGKWDVKPYLELLILSIFIIVMYLLVSLMLQRELVETIKMNLIKIRT